MTDYKIKKEKAKQEAIQWQHDFDQHNYSWFELSMHQERFTKLAKRYGLTKEFKENGII